VVERGGLNTVQAAPPVPAKPERLSVPEKPIAMQWSPLVTICRGRPDRRPLFCIHGAGGNVLNFKIISDRLGPEQPFYGLQAQGVDGRLPVLPTIEAMASQYLAAIRTVDPHGPYRLAGYSGGGVIAFEMAQQLKRDGAQVDLVAMIDTMSPTTARRKVSYLEKLWMMRHWSLDFYLQWPQRRRNRKLTQESYKLALDKLARGETLTPELTAIHLFRNFGAAQERYDIQPYDGSIVLFKATEGEMPYMETGPMLGWENHVRGSVHVTDINASHFSVMEEPGVSEVVKQLKAQLDLLDNVPEGLHSRVA
jgi:thioesterase domain-containing protein